MKKSGGDDGGGHQSSGGKSGVGGLYPIFAQDVKKPMRMTMIPVHDSPVSRRPRKQQPNSKPSSNMLSSKYPRKRSMQINAGALAPTKKNNSLLAQTKLTMDEEEEVMVTTHNSLFTFDGDSFKLEYGGGESFTQRRKIVVDGLRLDGIPSAALAVSRTLSQPPVTNFNNSSVPSDGPCSVSTVQFTNDEDYDSVIHTTGPMEAHRHFEFPAPSSLSPDDHHVLYLLKTVESPQVPNSAFRSISSEVLKILLSEMSSQEFLRRFVLIDCRYPYEYDGGHIKHAISLYDPHKVESMFYPREEERFIEINAKIPIFYCEFSQKRGPQMAKQLRRCDRARGTCDRWPFVDYKEIYLLDRGYHKFFFDYKELCEPQHYVPMIDQRYVSQLKKYDHHRKRRVERNLIKSHQSLLVDTQSGRKLEWPASRPPLSPINSPLQPSLTEYFAIKKKKGEGKEEGKTKKRSGEDAIGL